MTPPLSISDAQLANEAGDSLYESASTRQTTVAPGAGASICLQAAPAAGLYEITFIVGYGAVVDVVDNFRVFYQGVADIVLPANAIVNGEPTRYTIVKRLTGAQNVEIKTLTAGAAGSVFRCWIITRKIAE